MLTFRVARFVSRDNQVCSGVKKHRYFVCGEMQFLRPFTSDATRKLDIFGHDCYTLCVDGGQVGVFEEAH